MKRLFLLLILLSAITYSQPQRTQVRNALSFPANDSLKLRLYGDNDSTYLKVQSSGRQVLLGKRARTPYVTTDYVALELRSPDNDSALSSVYLDATGRILLSGTDRVTTTTPYIYFTGTGSTSPLLVFTSASDSGYIQYTSSGDKLFFSKPLGLPNGVFTNSARSIWANGDTLLFGTSTGRIPVKLNGASVNQVLKWDGGAWVAGTVSGSGGGADSIFAIQLSNRTSISSVVDTLSFDYLNFTKANSSGNAVTISPIQNIHTTASPTFDQLNLTGDSLRIMTPNGSKTVTIGTQNTAFNPLFLLPTASTGTFAVSATSPLVLSATTGDLTLSTVPPASGGTGSTTVPPAGSFAYGTGTALAYLEGTSGYFPRFQGSSNPVAFDLFGTANTFTASQTLRTGLVLGAASSVTGTVRFYHGSSNFYTDLASTAQSVENKTIYLPTVNSSSATIALTGDEQTVSFGSLTSTNSTTFTNAITLERTASTRNKWSLALTQGTTSLAIRDSSSNTVVSVKQTGAINITSNTNALASVGDMTRSSDSLLVYETNKTRSKILTEGDTFIDIYLRGDTARYTHASIKSTDKIIVHVASTSKIFNGEFYADSVWDGGFRIGGTYVGNPDSLPLFATRMYQTR